MPNYNNMSEGNVNLVECKEHGVTETIMYDVVLIRRKCKKCYENEKKSLDEGKDTLSSFQKLQVRS